MEVGAVIYRNIDALPQELRNLVRIADPATGELEFITQGLPDPNYNDVPLAVSIRIGNSALSERRYMRHCGICCYATRTRAGRVPNLPLEGHRRMKNATRWPGTSGPSNKGSRRYTCSCTKIQMKYDGGRDR